MAVDSLSCVHVLRSLLKMKSQFQGVVHFCSQHKGIIHICFAVIYSDLAFINMTDWPFIYSEEETVCIFCVNVFYLKLYQKPSLVYV